MRLFVTLVAIGFVTAGCQCEETKPEQGPATRGVAKPATDPDAVATLQQAKVKSTQLQIDQVIQALATYKVEKGAYPSLSQGLGVLVEGGFLPRPAEDGWGHALIYSLEDPDKPKVTSLGADGEPGGQGFDADISADQ